MMSPTIDFKKDTTTTEDDSSIVFENESHHHFSALKDYLARSLRSDVCFHSSNDRTALTMEASDLESSLEEEDHEDNENSLKRPSSALRLSMCGALHEAAEETEFHNSQIQWKSADFAKEEIARDDEKRMVAPRRASNPFGRRFSLQGSRRESVMSASIKEAFQQVRNTFEYQQTQVDKPALTGQQEQEPEEVSDLEDDDDYGFYDHYGYGDAAPDDKQTVSMAPVNRKASIGHRLESVCQGSMIEAFQQVHSKFEAPSKQQPHDTTDYGYGEATPDKQPVDYGYGDAPPTVAASKPSNARPCEFWDVQEEDDVAKYGYGNSYVTSRRQSGAHYDCGYGSDHDMDSTWHNGENMGNPSNRVLPHQDPAVQQPPSRRMRQRQNTLRRSWNAQEQPRRRVHRRSSVTKYNLEESMARIQREEEEKEQAAAAKNSRSVVIGKKEQQKKRKMKFFSSRLSTTKKNKKNSRKSLQCLRDFFSLDFKRHRSESNMTIGSSSFSVLGKTILDRKSRPSLWFRRSSSKNQPREV